MFTKEVSFEMSDNEIELQTIASKYGFTPKILDTKIVYGTCFITMEKIDEDCIADKYGETPEDTPRWIWDEIRRMVTILLDEEGIEYRDITGYNFIEKSGKIWMIDFGHARYRGPDLDWFVQEFIDGENSWNPDYK